jgi:hypothetical protein
VTVLRGPQVSAETCVTRRLRPPSAHSGQGTSVRPGRLIQLRGRIRTRACAGVLTKKSEIWRSDRQKRIAKWHPVSRMRGKRWSVKPESVPSKDRQWGYSCGRSMLLTPGCEALDQDRGAPKKVFRTTACDGICALALLDRGGPIDKIQLGEKFEIFRGSKPSTKIQPSYLLHMSDCDEMFPQRSIASGVAPDLSGRLPTQAGSSSSCCPQNPAGPKEPSSLLVSPLVGVSRTGCTPLKLERCVGGTALAMLWYRELSRVGAGLQNEERSI